MPGRYRLYILCMFAFAAMIAAPSLWRPRNNRPVLNVSCLNNFQIPSFSTKRSDVPADLLDLDGQRIDLIGFMFPVVERTGKWTDFVLRSSVHWDEHQPPLAQERVIVHVPGGAEEIADMARVTGIFHVKIEADELRKTISVFRMDAEKIVPYVAPTRPQYLDWLRSGGIIGASITFLRVAMHPLLAISCWIQQRRYKPGFCRVCGYDLRFSPDRCPECGTAAAQIERGTPLPGD